MDLYLASSEPGLTLQEMIDCDIKCGIEFEDGFGLNMDHLMQSHELDCLDISGMSNLENELDLKSFEPLFDPLDKLEEDDHVEVVESTPVLSKRDVIASWMNFSTNSFSMENELGAVVNPSAVLPSTLHGGLRSSASHGLSASAPISSPSPVHDLITRSSSESGPSIATSRSSGTLNSFNSNDPFTSKVHAITTKNSDLAINSTHQAISNSGSSGQVQSETINTRVMLHPISTATVTTPVSLPVKNGTHNMTFVTNALSRGSSTSVISIAASQSSLIQQLNSSTPAAASMHTSTNLTPTSNGTAINRTTTPNNFQQSRVITNTNLINRGKPIPKYKLDRTPEERTFPKPAYSYSCLIALALKNSITGSLPVSEIYSFMCEHFPYFRTAPNGWKNSVRHNLSLNKCFEKIEKPVVSGSNQRKGCLWALNPAKAHKMDEEVQKWSKKDLQGIKDAMTNPEILENLERGEMKFEATSSGASSCSEDEEEEEMDGLTLADAQTNTEMQQPIKILNPLGSTILSANSQHKNATRLLQANGLRTINHLTTKTINQVQKQSNHNSILGTQRTNQPDNQHIFRRSSQSNQEQEFILPDSTMQEISIQSNGAIIDDFGNEISLEGELGVLNPSGTSTGNLILRKVSSSPLRHTTIRPNFVYATSPHQNGLNRLVLANTKMS